MAMINMHQAKSDLSSLVSRAEAGEEIVIARRNKPAVRLVPVESHDKSGGTSDDYISKDDVAAYYRKYPAEWDEMRQMVGFAEEKQAEYDVGGIRKAVEAGSEFTIMREGKAVAKVVPVEEKKPRVPGRFAHLRGNLPPDLFDQPLTEDELTAWEGKYSADGDR
jgi:prevent-host-death family protein